MPGFSPSSRGAVRSDGLWQTGLGARTPKLSLSSGKGIECGGLQQGVNGFGSPDTWVPSN